MTHPSHPHAWKPVRWPAKRDLFGLQVSCVQYDEAVECIIAAAEAGEPAVVSCHAVHAVMTISEDATIRPLANRFAMITPDGQPVRWALNWLYGAKLKERVYGPELMTRVLSQAAERGLPIYLYGGSPETLVRLEANLLRTFRGLKIAGSCSPPFRTLQEAELADVANEINASGAQIVFIGLGCPKQDHFAARQAEKIRAVQLCVGAAFDFHADAKPIAPPWMQRCGLEWAFRLCCEPRRLWKRYLVTNTKFCLRLAQVYISQRSTRSPRRVAPDN